MNLLPVSSSPRMHQGARRMVVALVSSALALALVSVALPAAAQISFDRATTAPAQPAASAQAQPAPQISAPVPVAQQASLAGESSSPFSDSNSLFAADQASAPAQSYTAPAHAQGPHHTLGKTMAILGVVALGGGAVSFALADQHCKSDTGQICGGLHNGGIGLMAGGGALASVGFYWEFQKPKQH
jgi:hypothetical protein